MNKPNKTKHIDTEMVTRGEGMGRAKWEPNKGEVKSIYTQTKPLFNTILA